MVPPSARLRLYGVDYHCRVVSETLHSQMAFIDARIIAVNDGEANTINVASRGLVAQLFREDEHVLIADGRLNKEVAHVAVPGDCADGLPQLRAEHSPDVRHAAGQRLVADGAAGPVRFDQSGLGDDPVRTPRQGQRDAQRATAKGNNPAVGVEIAATPAPRRRIPPRGAGSRPAA